MPVNETSPLWLHCCPWWLVSNPVVAEITDANFWLEKNALTIIYNENNPLPLRIKNALKYYSSGYATGSSEYATEMAKKDNQ